MISDQEIIKQFRDVRPGPKVMKEIHDILAERQLQYMTRQFKKSRNRRGIIMPNTSTIHTLENGYFGSLGVSHPADLFTDNFGILMKECFSYSTFITAPNTFKEINGTTTDNYVPKETGLAMVQWWEVSTGLPQIQLGLGSTLVARSDFKIETPCTTAPENTRVSFNSPAGYANGLITMVENVGPFGATELVSEGAIFMLFSNTSSVVKIVCLARFNYTPTNIAVGKTAITTTLINI